MKSLKVLPAQTKVQVAVTNQQSSKINHREIFFWKVLPAQTKVQVAVTNHQS
jgi:hypothetical protein